MVKGIRENRNPNYLDLSVLFPKSWKWFAKPCAPGPLSVEALVALKMRDYSD